MCCVSAALVGGSVSSGLPFFTKSSQRHLFTSVVEVVLEYMRQTKRSRLLTEDSMILRSG